MKVLALRLGNPFRHVDHPGIETRGMAEPSLCSAAEVRELDRTAVFNRVDQNRTVDRPEHVATCRIEPQS